MKKIFLYTAVAFLSFSSCRKDDSGTDQVSIETQNSYDDQAIAKFLDEYYFDDQGYLVKFSATDTADDNEPKLSSYNPVKLSSGVVYIKRPTAQPSQGVSIGDSDVVKLMSTSFFYQAKNTGGVVQFETPQVFRNTIQGSGIPESDPFYYYAGKSVRGTKDRSYYEIEGFREGLKNFMSCEIPDSENYNLQGIIIVPSRAAYARDANINDYQNLKFQDRSFVFNFQIYKTTARATTDL